MWIFGGRLHGWGLGAHAALWSSVWGVPACGSVFWVAPICFSIYGRHCRQGSWVDFWSWGPESSFLLSSRRARWRRKSCARCQEGPGQTGHKCIVDGGGREPKSSDRHDEGLPGPKARACLCHSCRRSVGWSSHHCSKDARTVRRDFEIRSWCQQGSCSCWPPSKDQGTYPWTSSSAGHHGRGRARSWCRSSFLRTRCRSDPNGFGSAEFSDHIACGSFGRRSRRHVGSVSLGFWTSRRRHSWCSKARSYDAGPGCQQVELFHGRAAAAPQKAQPVLPCPFHRRGVACLRCIDPHLLRTVWGIPEKQRIGVSDVVVGAYSRRFRQRQHPLGPRAHSSRSLCSRAGSPGSGRMVVGVSAWTYGRPASSDVSRSLAERDGLREEFWPPHPVWVGSDISGFPQGDGSVAEPQDRNQEDQGGATNKGSRCRVSLSQKETPLSEEAQTRRRSLSLQASVRAPSAMPSGASQVPPSLNKTPKPKKNPCKHEPGPQGQLGFDFELSFDTWCSHLTFNCLRSRTPFSEFLAKSMKPPCEQCPTSSTVFPLPAPFPSPFDRMPKGVSSRVRKKIHFQRAMHCVVMALNFWHSGGDFSILDLLHRPPSSVHKVVFGRIRSLLRADGQFPKFRVIGAGRRFPQLSARLREATEFVIRSGVSAEPYSKQYEGAEVAFDDSVLEELRPYRDADASRIRLKGRGHWDITEFLPDSLCMAFREPLVIFDERIPEAWEYPRIREKPEQIASLARLWDVHGLLRLHDQPPPRHEWVRIFGCFKDKDKDRQIGDRRGRNACEKKVVGPSAELPAGSDLCDIVMDVKSQSLHISVTDRSDFYHQIAVTRARALTNTLGPGFPADLVSDTKALGIFTLQAAQKKSRLAHGDGLFLQKPVNKSRPGILFASFDSVLQGDHAGVEFACAAHGQLLRNFDLLSSPCVVLGSCPTLSRDRFQGLVIDDFFSISLEPKHTGRLSRSAMDFDTAQRAYLAFDLQGSPEKDTRDSCQAKVIGAEVRADETSMRFGCPTVGSPASKRFGLSWLSLQLCQLSHTTDSLHLSLLGGWTSTLMYRRPFMSILQHAFSLVPSDNIAKDHAKLVALPRRVATELVLLSVLAPLIKTDIGVPYASELFATDASSSRGAVVATEVSSDVYEALFRCCKNKGSYTRLLSGEEQVFSQLDFGSIPADFQKASVQKPLAYRFSFIEVFAGSAKVTRFVAEQGYSVGPPIELSVSEEFDLRLQHVSSWLSWLISENLILGFMVGPPCTTFSVMRRPALRDKDYPFGFNPHEEQTATGNILGQRGFQMLAIGRRNRVVGLLETPNSSKLKNLPSWRALASHGDVFSTRCDSCRYGSIHLKSFKFLSVGMRPRHASLRCKCSVPHVPVQGAYTKQSATYTDQLAKALALDFVESFELLLHEDVEPDEVVGGGLENQLVNEVAISSTWRAQASWAFRRPSHINLLELKSLLRLVLDLVKRKDSVRFVALVDSIVTRGSVSKGRSSSFAVAAILRQICSLCIIGGLYAVTPFVPTRLNVADDPTRDRPPRPPCPGLALDTWSRSSIFALARIASSKKWISNWVRLVLFVVDPVQVIPFDRSSLRRPSRSFDSTLGYPGEGPFFALVAFGFLLFLCWRAPSACVHPCPFLPCLLCLCLSSVRSCHGAVIGPRNEADGFRAANRHAVGPLPSARQVLPITKSNREAFLASFFQWCRDQELDIENVFSDSWRNIEEINRILVAYGRALYSAGRPHSHYIECINAVTSYRPVLRRSLQEAWDLGFSWVRQEPSTHHVAAPFQVCLAMLATCLLWGWTRTAGAIAFCFGGLLRPGEMISAVRRQLLLPSDVAHSTSYALLSILEPKTRFRAARHQYAKVDIPDLLRVLEVAFSKVSSSGKLWPFSGQTLRTRFQTILKAVGLPVSNYNGMKPLDLGSLRAGGATWLMQTTESSDFVQRRGRWINGRVMNIYLQETTALQYLKGLPAASIDRVMSLAQSFPEILEKAEIFSSSLIPTSSWFLLFCRPKWERALMVNMGDVGQISCNQKGLQLWHLAWPWIKVLEQLSPS